MDAINSDGMEFPVSVWMKKVGSDGDHRVIVVIEPVARTSAKFELDHGVSVLQFHSLLALQVLLVSAQLFVIIIYYHQLTNTLVKPNHKYRTCVRIVLIFIFISQLIW